MTRLLIGKRLKNLLYLCKKIKFCLTLREKKKTLSQRLICGRKCKKKKTQLNLMRDGRAYCKNVLQKGWTVPTG